MWRGDDGGVGHIMNPPAEHRQSHASERCGIRMMGTIALATMLGTYATLTSVPEMYRFRLDCVHFHKRDDVRILG